MCCGGTYVGSGSDIERALLVVNFLPPTADSYQRQRGLAAPMPVLHRPRSSRGSGLPLRYTTSSRISMKSPAHADHALDDVDAVGRALDDHHVAERWARPS